MKHVPGQWAITVDHNAKPDTKPATNENAVGMFGPRRATMTAEEIIAHPDSKRFRIADDDGNAVYEGLCYLPEGLTEDAFGPLDDFGQPNAGATEIWYWSAENGGQWEQL